MNVSIECFFAQDNLLSFLKLSGSLNLLHRIHDL
ncbi:hypothetical protein SLEP1_g8585 [Rubroshorea leprosula]|uniref:Maturase K n=1 Tax=Rubroshorea leprosula TaxID=152421 RepID=A0AAV5IA34_9ROSI|nr:hypothetical protein SLEP1_g8585 [Rubroshorea leprosula]